MGQHGVPVARGRAAVGNARAPARLVADRESTYFASRPYGSRLGALASPQSSVIASRAVLEERYSDPALRRRATYHCRRSGAGTSSFRTRWSSGRAGRTGCTTGCVTGASCRMGSGCWSGWRRRVRCCRRRQHGAWRQTTGGSPRSRRAGGTRPGAAGRGGYLVFVGRHQAVAVEHRSEGRRLTDSHLTRPGTTQRWTTSFRHAARYAIGDGGHRDCRSRRRIPAFQPLADRSNRRRRWATAAASPRPDTPSLRGCSRRGRSPSCG